MANKVTDGVGLVVVRPVMDRYSGFEKLTFELRAGSDTLLSMDWQRNTDSRYDDVYENKLTDWYGLSFTIPTNNGLDAFERSQKLLALITKYAESTTMLTAEYVAARLKVLGIPQLVWDERYKNLIPVTEVKNSDWRRYSDTVGWMNVVAPSKEQAVTRILESMTREAQSFLKRWAAAGMEVEEHHDPLPTYHLVEDIIKPDWDRARTTVVVL